MANQIRSDDLHLSGQMIATIVAGLVVLTGGLMTVHAPLRPLAYTFIGVGGALFVWFLALQVRRKTRADLEPDLLPLLFPHYELVQTGAAHLWAFAFQVGGAIRFAVAAQNTTDGRRRLDVLLPVRDGAGLLLAEAAPVRVELGPAELAVATLDIPCLPRAGGVVRLGFVPVVSGSGGRMVRFKLRPAVQKRSAVPNVNRGKANGGEAFMDVQVTPAEPAAPPTPAEPRVLTLWRPGQPVDAPRWTQVIQTMLGYPGRTPTANSQPKYPVASSQ